MKWETDIYPFLDKENLKYWANKGNCETALIHWVEAWRPATLAMMYLNYLGDRRECIWYLECKDYNGPAQGYWFAWSGQVPDKQASESWLLSVLTAVQQHPALSDITFDSKTGDSELADFKRNWPLAYGMNYNQQWLVSFCKSIDRLSHKEPEGKETQFGADVRSALESAAAMMNDAEVLEAGNKYVMHKNDLHSDIGISQRVVSASDVLEDK